MKGRQRPDLETVESIIDNYTLPLLVQRSSGDRLLLTKCVRLPYVVCQSLDHPQSSYSAVDHTQTNEYFLIPLNNKGFYGAVSSHDEPTLPYTSLSQILLHHHSSSASSLTPELRHSSSNLNSTKQGRNDHTDHDNSTEVLCDNVTPIREYDKDSKKFIHKVLLPGDTISIPAQSKSCPLLESRSNGFCCFRPTVADLSAEHTICIRDTHKHIHDDRHIEGRFYKVKRGQIDHMEMGTVYSLSDITRHQALPRVVGSISTKQTAKDEVPLPSVFRMVSVMSDRILVGYTLWDRGQPQPEHQIELSANSEERFIIAESDRVDMSDIRQHQPIMSIRKAEPGVTISSADFAKIIRKSGHLPPKLPSRPSTLRLRSDSRSKQMLSLYARNTVGSDKHNNPERVGYTSEHGQKITGEGAKDPSIAFAHGTARYQNSIKQVYQDRPAADGPTTITDNPKDVSSTMIPPFHKVNSSSCTVRLPTRDTSKRSILKKFSTVSVRFGKNKKHPSMKTILDNFHNKKEDDLDFDVLVRKKPKKSLRGLEIVHVLPDAQPPSPGVIADPHLPGQQSEKSSYATFAAVQQSRQHALLVDQEYSENIRSSSSCSTISSVDDVKSVEDFIHSQYRFLDHHRESSSHYSTQTPSQLSGEYSPQCDDVTSHSPDERLNRKSLVRFNTGSTTTVAVADSDSETVICRINGNELRRGGEQVIRRQSSSRSSKDHNDNKKQLTNHLDEIKLRFSQSRDGGLQVPSTPATTSISQTGASSEEPKSQLYVRRPQPQIVASPISELTLKVNGMCMSDNLALPSAATHTAEIEDPYLLPIKRSSAKIHIT